MKIFFKYFGLALAVQVLLLVLGVAVSYISGPAFEWFLIVYEPFMLLIAKFGNYHGEASMIEPVIKGVPLGVLVFSLMAGALASAIAWRKR